MVAANRSPSNPSNPSRNGSAYEGTPRLGRLSLRTELGVPLATGIEVLAGGAVASAPMGTSREPYPTDSPLTHVPEGLGRAWWRDRFGAGEHGVMTTVSLRASQTFERRVLDFLTHLELERGLARNTLAAYRVDLAQFGAFLADRGRDALAVESDELAAFVDKLAIDRAGRTPLSAATLQRKISCLRSFYRHLHRSGMIERNPASELTGPRLAKRRPQSISRRDIHQLLAQPRGTSPAALRDRALLELLYACGIRLDLATAVLRVDANGPRERLVPVPSSALGAIRGLPPPRPPAARRTT